MESMESEATYEIFKKATDNTTVLIEVVKGIDEAKKRIDELNGAGPAEYFIVHPDKANGVDPQKPSVPTDPFAP